MAAVVGAAHAAHHRRDLLPEREAAARAREVEAVVDDDDDGLDAWYVRGKVTPSAKPRRVCSSGRFRPNALTASRTHPGRVASTGRSVTTRFSTRPGPLRTTARIVSFTPALLVPSGRTAGRTC
ncbi:hypothetical protein ACIBO4_04630 [Streptomyces sp. NPDC050149]|uniref:hypothetical protein n=1 Tax=Streptomyces sp. NPDC050149 TaxID=3365603 RepID=UPI0037A1DF86